MLNLSATVIESYRLRMIPVIETYVRQIFTNFTPAVTTYMFPQTPAHISDTRKFIETSRHEREAGESFMVTILDKKTGEFLGGGGLSHIDTPTPELGIWIKTAAHGQGFGREAVTSLCEWAESNLLFDHLIYPVDQDNVASRKIPESLGGTVHKQYQLVNQAGKTLHIVEYWIPPSQATSSPPVLP